MNFKRERVVEYYLRDTDVENIFINEYMTSAPGDYVKVYLFALMYAGYSIPMDNSTVAKQLGMAVEDVLKAWSYWEESGVVKKHYADEADKFNYKVEFLNLKEKMYCSQKKSGSVQSAGESKASPLEDAQIKEMFARIEKISGRLLGGKEPIEIISWIEDYGASPEIIILAYEHTMKVKKHSSHKYVGAVLKEWIKKGLFNRQDVEKYLSDNDSRHYLYKRVLKSLGFMRNPTEAEKTIMDTWFDELGLSIDRVLEACGKTSGISNPNINYVNSVLKAWEKGGGKTGGGGNGEGKTNYISSVIKSYEETRFKNEKAAEERRREVFEKIPQIQKMEEETRGLTLEMSKLMLGGGTGGKIKLESVKKKITALNTEKAFLLTENNFNPDYMDIMYTCPLCKDTGTQDTGDRCVCFAERLKQIQKMG